MKVYVKKVSAAASVYDVIRALSGYGQIIHDNCKLEAGSGFVEFVNENDAKSCISDALFAPPICMGKSFDVSKHAKKPKKKRKNYASFDEVKFTLSGLEMGNWGGRSPIISPNSGDNPSPKSFTFLSEWKIYENLTICFSKAEKAYLLEGFRAFDETKRVRISYRTLLEDPYAIFLDKKDGVISLYISLKHPPFLYRQDKRWIRTIDWTRINDNIFEDIFGRCLVYKLIFRDDIDLDELRDEIANLRLISPPESKSIVRCIDKSSNYPIKYFENIIHKLPFRLYYKLACLVSHGILSLYEIEENRLDERLKDLISGTYGNVQNNNQNLEATVWYALNQITMKDWNPFNVERQDRPITDFEPAIKNFKGDFNDWHPSNPNFHLENNFRSVWVNHATITPTKIYFDEPNYEASNRILRLYKEKIDRFLRVTFKEENFDKLFVNEDDDLDITDHRIVDILKKGFYLAERHYEFLAFSSSQLRDQSCWFVASDGNFNANYIRSMMGDFSEIKGPALYAARMGQCFTSTIGTLQPEHVKYIDDIKNSDYVFSDGCGKISPSLAARAAKEHLGTKISDKDEIPSVFQIRFGGCKGMVAVDPTLKGDVLCIRPSQRKFNAPDPLYLEIVKTVKTSSPGYLNRQIILLLSTLGVPDDVFIPLQNQMRDDINSIMTDKNNALEICKRNMGTRETSHIKSTIISMIDAGMMQGNIDPFLKAILECKRVYTLKSLRYKARILMPNSFLLLGVIDETGILEEDEIYVQTSTIVSEQQTSKSKVWTPAIIARNPCLHPGDIRNVKVVDVKKLSHLKNCVVFSQKGNRPLPNMLAGGDLDGDEFFVCFDKRIFIPRNEEPMVYDSQGREELDRPVVMNDICNFFKNFMLNDRLGQIDNLHLAHADSNSKGVKSTGCIVLAELHSQAVDFNKTGKPVNTKLPNIDENPDFMEVKCKPSYKSEKILGKLYRNIKLHEYESDPILKYKEHKITVNDDFIFDGYQKCMDKEAIVIRNLYNGEIRKLMKTYRVNNESEIITAELLGIKQMEGRKNQHKRDVISDEVSNIINRYRKQFLNGIQDDTNNNTNHGIKPIKIPINEKSKAKASAWYHVTYDHPEKDNNIILLSFPWVVSDILLAIRKEKHERTN
ncbi:RNA dependent RNA polymerase-domain-containing protein [Rhizophagus diaphanus]|nr:RNA dependent RNA polymerase-domain-containing protein [Rhizophagus diaphanus] [Rhizophagus sp. MUCL 43196]